MQCSWVHRPERAEPVASTRALRSPWTTARPHRAATTGRPAAPGAQPHRAFGWAAQVAAMVSDLGWEHLGRRAPVAVLVGRRHRLRQLPDPAVATLADRRVGRPLGVPGRLWRLVASLVRVGMIQDATHNWWDVRPSAKYPTLELRITDLATTVDEAVMLAGLTRAVAIPATPSRRGHPASVPQPELLGAARWRAAATAWAASRSRDHRASWSRPGCWSSASSPTSGRSSRSTRSGPRSPRWSTPPRPEARAHEEVVLPAEDGPNRL